MASGILGILGGSGLYEIEGLSNREWIKIESPFGDPSDELLFGELDGQKLVFLPRHGRGHTLSPGAVNYRANIDALKRAGVTELLSLSAVGSFKEELSPGTFVVIDQFVDRTRNRERSFFHEGVVAHVSMAHPTCNRLADSAFEAAQGLGLRAVRGGTYVGMEGPQFSTLAESKLYKSWDCDIIGMTNVPEAFLAREAEICYATVGMVTDYDCWHPDHDAVQVADIVRVLLENADNARSLVKKVAPEVTSFARPCPHSCQRSLEDAIITGEEARDPAVVLMLDAVAGRVLKSNQH
ncbi:MAG: S-methyl-5'-thioadenosine phosphorylase [Myxococcota bacterium]|jgi:5'-methylthioadenosine phosphorylase|nr:S-methyl-5'-thioadenosine phosphorylase [Myxococcota bacterium]